MIRATVAACLLAATPHHGIMADDQLEPHMSILGVRLTEESFGDAFQALGPAEIRDNGGDAAAHANAACFEARDGTVLALLSSGELGGGWLTSFQLVRHRRLVDFSGDPGGEYTVPETAQPKCVRLPRLSSGTRTAGGLRLGMRRREVVRLLGNPCDSGDDYVRFCSVREVSSTSEQRERFKRQFGEGTYETFSVHRWVRVEFKQGIAVAIRVEQSYS